MMRRRGDGKKNRPMRVGGNSSLKMTMAAMNRSNMSTQDDAMRVNMRILGKGEANSWIVDKNFRTKLGDDCDEDDMD
eukprot:CAMPEP_0167741038 /NCGR_PEP_ID=MMETSP0110_2-20121227/633_1 /TAXON_ID=629695 /ORGANISM="Gymnochlora sp., Strain CCMP2014" /LENGTH=76 /DNA_ID=CAMNT_0007625043 /DNA_START=47 /DNA_END=277 /DNA_ORIENTATION=-